MYTCMYDCCVVGNLCVCLCVVVRVVVSWVSVPSSDVARFCGCRWRSAIVGCVAVWMCGRMVLLGRGAISCARVRGRFCSDISTRTATLQIRTVSSLLNISIAASPSTTRASVRSRGTFELASIPTHMREHTRARTHTHTHTHTHTRVRKLLQPFRP